MTREDYVAEEKRKVREVAIGIGVPSAEAMGKAELAYALEHWSPEVWAELQSYLQKYRDWWQLELDGTSDSTRHALAAQEKKASEARLNEAMENALRST